MINKVTPSSVIERCELLSYNNVNRFFGGNKTFTIFHFTQQSRFKQHLLLFFRLPAAATLRSKVLFVKVIDHANRFL